MAQENNGNGQVGQGQGTGYQGGSRMEGIGGMDQGLREGQQMRVSSGTMRSSGMGGGEDEIKAKLERHAKMKKYKEKHDKAVATFKTLTGETVETREGAVKALAWIMKNKTYTQAAEAIAAMSDFCWACNEKDAEKDVGEEVETLSRLMR